MLAIFDRGRDESRSRGYGARSAQSYQSRTWEPGLTPSSVSCRCPCPQAKLIWDAHYAGHCALWAYG